VSLRANEVSEAISVFGIAEPVPSEARNLLSLLLMTAVYVLRWIFTNYLKLKTVWFY